MRPKDLFTRDTLLPSRAQEANSSRPPPRSQDKLLELERAELDVGGLPVDLDALVRPTQLPQDSSAEEHALRAMSSLDQSPVPLSTPNAEGHSNVSGLSRAKRAQPSPHFGSSAGSPAGNDVRANQNQSSFSRSNPAAGEIGESIRAEPSVPFKDLEADMLKTGTEGGHELSRPTQPASVCELQRPQGSMTELFALGDFSGALRRAELVLEHDPHDAVARQYARSCIEVLQEMCLARLGSLDHVPEVCVSLEKLKWLSIDHRAGFILSRVDGNLNARELLDVCGMDRLEAMQLLVELLDKKVLSLKD